MAKIKAGEIVDLIYASKTEAKIGDFKWSALNESAFEEEHLGQWMLCDGRSCNGTAYHLLTGTASVPNALTNGAFLRQAKVGRTLGSFEAEDFKSHTHTQDAHNHIDGFAGVNANSSYGTTTAPSGNVNSQGGVSTNYHAITSSTIATNQNTGGAETRPNNIALNLYVKVGY